MNAGNGGHPNYNKMWTSILYHKPKAGDIMVLITWFPHLLQENPKYAKYFSFYYPQKELRLFDRPHSYGKYVWVDRVHLSYQYYAKLGDCLADKVISICEEEDECEDIFSASGWDVAFPDEVSLSRSRYWKFQHFRDREYLEYVRKNALLREENNTARWLNFKVIHPLDEGKRYRIYLLLKYNECIFFRLFLHGNGKIDYLPQKKLEAEKWTEIKYDYIPSHADIHWLSFSATNFISAGQKLCIRKISITEADDLEG